MMRKCFALFLVFLQVSGPAFASVLTVEDVSVIGAAADDYYIGSKSKLKIIDGGNIGRTMVPAAELSSSFALSGLVAGAAGIAGIAYYERTGQDPIYAAASAVASAADAIFTPAYQAFKANFVSPESFPASAPHYVGLESAVGATIEDLACAVNDAPENYPVLKAAMDENYTPGGSSTTQDLYTNGVAGLTFYHPDGNLIYGSGSWVVYANSLLPGMLEYYFPHGYTTFASGNNDCYIGVWQSGYLILIMTPGQYEPHLKGTHGTAYYLSTTGTPTGNMPSFPAGDGAYNYPGLKSALSSPSPVMAEEIKQAIQNMPTEQKITSSDPAPTQVPAPNPSPITNNQIQNFFTENTANVYNEYLETVTNNITNPGDISNEVAQAAAETAKAQEEEANKESEETFSPISSNPFEKPYNPGDEFDIPTRFTSFLNNVKSSGLFSFSSAFFESLPGGGSPVYQIDGGETFGTHTIDLSDTLTGGLAILKTILLACFGFLSIRAVIMKR